MSVPDTEGRLKRLRDQVAYVDADGVDHLPNHEVSHVKNAISRWSQTVGAGADIGDKAEGEAEENLESTAVDRYPPQPTARRR